MLGLLALALFPVAANAECSTASCITYEVEEAPHVNEPTTKPKEHKSSAHHESSNNAKAEGSGAKVGTGSSGEPESKESEESHKSGATSNGGSNNPPKSGGGEGGGGPKSGNEAGAQSKDNIANSKPLPTESHASGGGSSPVVPILIAVAVLAAISIGVVLYRQRRSGAGPDGSVSSPNAS
ncbi:MAG: hypothetical protein JSS68_19605 [Actinobacteria bacterium]|nr:hypothetical protein [Actinomycetota bacterium]